MKVADLMRRHPTLDTDRLARLDALYRGGAALRAALPTLMPAHFMEPTEVTFERRQRAAYENHLGPVVDQWAGEVMAASLSLTPSGAAAMPAWVAGLKTNADRQGTDWAAFWRGRLTRALVDGTAWVLIDMPAVSGATLSDRGQAEQVGLAQPYLVGLDAAQVLDWETDAQGGLTWALVYTCRSERPSLAGGRQIRRSWTLWTRQGWQRFELVHPWEKPPRDEDDVSEVASGIHPLGRVPLIPLTLPDGLWMSSLLEDPARALFETQCALEWSLYKSAFAVPVFQTQDEITKVSLSVGRFLRLEREDKYGWLEPSGQGWDALDRQAIRRMEGIYRIGRQLAQSATHDSSRARQSGAAKTEDRKPTVVVLLAYGALVTEAMRQALAVAAGWRREEATVQVTGLDEFEGSTLDVELERALILQSLRVPSASFSRAVLTRVAERYLEDAAPEVIAQVREEIAAGVQARAQVEDLYTPEALNGGRTPPAPPAR